MPTSNYFEIYGTRFRFDYFVSKLNEAKVFGENVWLFHESCQRGGTWNLEQLVEKLKINEDIELYVCDSWFLVFDEEKEQFLETEGLEIFIGKSWSSIGDYQTGLEFKTEIEEMIRKYFHFIDDVEIFFDTECMEYN